MFDLADCSLGLIFIRPCEKAMQEKFHRNRNGFFLMLKSKGFTSEDGDCYLLLEYVL